MNEAQSTTVTSVSRRAMSLSDVPDGSLKVNVSATGNGSLMPELSMRM